MVRRANVVVRAFYKNGMRVTLKRKRKFWRDNRVADLVECFHQFGVTLWMFKTDLIRKPFLRESQCLNGVLNRHSEIKFIYNDGQNCVRDSATTGAAGDQHNAAILGDDGWSHRTNRAFA